VVDDFDVNGDVDLDATVDGGDQVHVAVAVKVHDHDPDHDSEGSRQCGSS
jgi:hypothetical protein